MYRRREQPPRSSTFARPYERDPQARQSDRGTRDPRHAGDLRQTVARNVSKPLCVNMGFGIRGRTTTPLLSASRLQELGTRVVIYPRLLTACAVQGMKN